MIIQAEKEQSDSQKELETHEKIREKNHEKIVHLQSKYKEEEQLHKQSQQEFRNITNQLMARIQQGKHSSEAVCKAKKLHKDKQMQFNTAERKVVGTEKEISVLKEAIEKDNNVVRNKWAEKHALWNEKVKGIHNEREKQEQDMRTEDSHRLNIQNTLDVKKKDLMQVLLEEKAIKRHCYTLEQELQGLQSQQGNQFTVYGQWVPQLLQEIDVAYRKGLFSKKPVGPLGAFIKLRDNNWGHVAEMVIGNRISAFCVDNRNDEKVLGQIMKKVRFYRQAQPIVIMARFREQVHDVSRFEVQSHRYPSLWSVLSVSDTVIANTLIDQMQVESALLIPTAQEAGQILKDKATVPRNCKVAYTLNRDTYYPDPEYRLYSGRGQQPARFLQVSVEQKVRDLSLDLENSKAQLQVLNQEIHDLQENIRRLEDEVKVSTRKLLCNKRKVDQLRLQLADLQNQEEPSPPDVSQLEEEIKQQEVILKEAKDHLEEVRKEVVSSKDAFTIVSSEFEKLKNDEKTLLEEAENMKEKVDQVEAKVNRLLQTVEAYERKGNEYLQNKKKAERRLKTANETLKNELQGANQFQPRLDTVRSVEEVQRQYSGLQDRLNKETAQRGDPLAVAEKYKNTKKRFTTVSFEIETHANLIKIIEDSLRKRLDRFKHFRKLLSIMVKTNFKSNLTHRNLNGCLNFDFENKTLSLNVVKMGDQSDSTSISIANSGRQNKKQLPQQTLAMMSGGERSFATVSFLLALWEVLESPIRILDEFDVFMDIVARRQSMSLMINAAKSKTQYIYLTPLELDLALHPNINRFMMPDPEREEADK
ncbi:structural maintenance of chromosomes protein 6-like [Panulirus ornatus]|uniref:structural maintenance of chromosomes protein 6-like n=1 Tax=Panulirus ornatus TaxID=150431 RepID=UPI003A877E3C